MQVQYSQNLNHQDDIIEERALAIQELYQQQLECHEIMKNIKYLVEEQGEVVDDIQSAIRASNKNVMDGQKSLVNAEEYQKTNITLSLYVLLATTITTITGGLITWAVI